MSSVLRPHQHSIGYTGDGFYSGVRSGKGKEREKRGKRKRKGEREGQEERSGK